MAIYTARIGYSGTDGLDVTRRGNSPFGPSWALLQAHLTLRREGRETEESWQQYTASYTYEMLRLRAEIPHVWESLEQRVRVGATLLCYCGRSAHCHRRLLAEMLAQSTGVLYEGERVTTKTPFPTLGEQLVLPGIKNEEIE